MILGFAMAPATPATAIELDSAVFSAQGLVFHPVQVDQDDDGQRCTAVIVGVNGTAISTYGVKRCLKPGPEVLATDGLDELPMTPVALLTAANKGRLKCDDFALRVGKLVIKGRNWESWWIETIFVNGRYIHHFGLADGPRSEDDNGDRLYPLHVWVIAEVPAENVVECCGLFPAPPQGSRSIGLVAHVPAETPPGLPSGFRAVKLQPPTESPAEPADDEVQV